jgi:thymidine kinase
MASEFSFNGSPGFLEIIFGPMYCGKTTSLIRKLNIYGEMNLRVLYVNHSIDNRSDEDFSTHNSAITKLGNISHSMKISKLEENFETLCDYDVIGIDESQFFPDLKEAVLRLVDDMNKIVIVAGLSGDYQKKPFGQIIDLVPHADEITKLKPFCSWCAKTHKRFRDAHFTYRLIAGESQILIGGRDQYIPVCRECYQI